MQQQGRIIQQQAALIAQLTSGQILVQALRDDENDSEPIAGDIVKVKKFQWEWLPIEVDLPTLMRELKERFKKN